MNKKLIFAAVAMGLTGHSMMAMEAAEKEKKSWTTTNKLIGAGALAGAGTLAYNNQETVKNACVLGKIYALHGYKAGQGYCKQAADWVKSNQRKAATYGLGAGLLVYAGYKFLQRENGPQQKIAQPSSAAQLFDGRAGSKYEQDVRKKYPDWLAGKNGLVDLLRLVYPQDTEAKIIQPLVNKAFTDNPHVLLSDTQLLKDMAMEHKVQLFALCGVFLEEQKDGKVIELIDSLSDEQQAVRFVLADALKSDNEEIVLATLSDLTVTNRLTEKQRKDVTGLCDFVVCCFEAQRTFLEGQGII